MKKAVTCVGFVWVIAVLKALADPTDLELASPIADNAVLQRGMDVPIWGWAKPESDVVVTFAGKRTEAYFYRNDFYPFVKAELQAHDPHLFELLVAILGPLK